MTCITKVCCADVDWTLLNANFSLGEGHFEDASNKASGAVTPVETPEETPKRGPRGGSGKSKKAKTAKQRLAIIDAEGDLGMSGD